MRIFLTGGTGFIGGHFINDAIGAGHTIIATRRALSKPRIKLAEEPVWLDSNLDELPQSAFNGVDIVVHLAAHSANVPYDSIEQCLHWNVTVPIRMAERAYVAGVRNYLVAGSCFEYGLSANKYLEIPVTAPLRPFQTYPISKACASIAWDGFARNRKVMVTVPRFFQVYGDGEQPSRLWPSMVAAARSGSDFRISSGTQVRDFVHVGDISKRLVKALSIKPEAGEAKFVNFGNGIVCSVADFARLHWEKSKAKGRLIIGGLAPRPDELMRVVSDKSGDEYRS